MLPIIAEHCPKIRSINCDKASVNGLKKLSEKCRNITELSIKEFEEEDELDEVLKDLISNNKKLQFLDIRKYEGNGDCLLKLNFEEIITIKIASLQDSEQNEEKLINVIEKSKNLSSFKYGTANLNVFEALEGNCKNLRELDLKLDDYSDIDDVDRSLSDIFINNEKLKSLKLRNFNGLTGKSFLSLSEKIIEKLH